MMRDSESRTESSAARGRTAVCLVLIALLLYNPFFTILSISHDLSIQQPLSYRATLAGSELRRCTFEAPRPLTPALDAVIVLAAAMLTPRDEGAVVQPSDTPVPLVQALGESIWFRPPPSA
jgi:hypothetical protein